MDHHGATPEPSEKLADLVLEGGGVKGIALAGALEVLEERGYRFNRVAGSSAGAIAGALVAADIPTPQLVNIMRDVDYERFQDGPFWTRFLIGKAISILLHNGIYRGEYLKSWLAEQLAAHGGSHWTGTFADVPYRDPDPEREYTASHRYRLVVTASDISSGRLRYLPWDFDVFGRDPARQRIVDAVRASIAIPFFYRPVTWKNKAGRKSWLVDGGMLSSFPISVFDTSAEETPRWPTFGIKLSARPETDHGIVYRITGPLSFAVANVRTMMGFFDRLHVDSSDAVARTIFIDTSAVEGTDFDLSDEDREVLYQNGRRAATEFLDGTGKREAWDFEKYIARYRKSS